MLKKTRLMLKSELMKTRLMIYVLSAVTVLLFAVGVSAQKQTQSRTHGEPQSQTQSKHDQHDGMSHDGGMSHEDCPMMRSDKSKLSADKSNASADEASHAGHLAAVNERGGRAMGFSQTATTHHFILMRDGGAIQVEVNDPKDAANRDAIRMHLAHIAQMFAQGNFDTPMLVHDQVPPGVSVMQRLKAGISYVYEETVRGARVRISTSDKDALAAVHDFLRFQIKEHQTGDSLDVSSR
jgi:hypothetical protein